MKIEAFTSLLRALKDRIYQQKNRIEIHNMHDEVFLSLYQIYFPEFVNLKAYNSLYQICKPVICF